MTVTAEIPIFALPLSPLPGEVIPLNIFEPRYKEMLSHCLEHTDLKGDFGILYTCDGVTAELGCRVSLAKVEELQGGRFYFIHTIAREPFRFVKYTKKTPFPMGEVEDIKVNFAGGCDSHREKIVQKLLSEEKVCNEKDVKIEKKCSDINKTHEEKLMSLNSFQLAILANSDIRERNDLLKCLDETERLKRLHAFMKFKDTRICGTTEEIQ